MKHKHPDNSPLSYQSYLKQWLEVKKILKCPEGIGLRPYSLLVAKVLESARAYANVKRDFPEDANTQLKAAANIVKGLAEIDHLLQGGGPL